MANNTIMTAKNTFAEGLVMDFAPDNTQASVLTSALNATLLTFNGNEMSLLNDMGNGRVETAFLPEGYVPVGTCEFGDIIYIVSYNPLINKSLIGCFPSPERNISSEEISLLGQQLTYKDFLEVDEGGNPTGKLKTTSVKKVILEKSLNPGDKYFIYTDKDSISSNDEKKDNKNCLTDVGNSTRIYGDYPKLLKLHVVAIEDSGKINYLDNTVKWYNKAPEGLDYFILELALDNVSLKPDLNSYRTLISDAYTVFQSKVSGKLAILAELEKVKGFSCTHSVLIDDTNNYHVYLHTSWETDDEDINPSGYYVLEEGFNPKILDSEGKDKEVTKTNRVTNYSRHYELENAVSYAEYVEKASFNSLKEKFISDYIGTTNDTNYIPTKITLLKEHGLYSSEFVYNALNSDDTGYYFSNKEGSKYYVYTGGKLDAKYGINLSEKSDKYYSDTFIHNYFNVDITKKFFEVSFNSTDLNNVIYEYEVCPAMPYGYLEEYKISNSIDFGKIGKKHIELNEWRYHNDGVVSTLTFGLEAYTEPEKGISKVELEFYDNNGLTGRLVLKNRKSYSGVFTEVLTLDTTDNLNIDGVKHPGQKLELSGVDLTGFENIEDTTERIKKITDVTSKTEDELKNLSKKVEEGGGNDLENLQYLYINNVIIDDGTDLFQNDTGILYSNWLYLVKVKVHYQNYNSLGDFDSENATLPIEFTRWYWTNDMWNEYYYNIQDYINLQPEINILVQGAFKENERFKKYVDNIPNITYDSGKIRSVQKQTLGWKIYKLYSEYVNNENKVVKNAPNLGLTLVPQLYDSYDTFSLNINNLENLKYTIYEENNSNIEVEIPEKIYPEGVFGTDEENLIEPIITKPDPLYEYIKCDLFNLDIKNTDLEKEDSTTDNFEYVDTKGNKKTVEGYNKYTITADLFFEGNNPTNILYPILLLLDGEFYSKLMCINYTPININCKTYSQILNSLNDLEDHNLTISVFNGDPNDTNSTSEEYIGFKYLCGLAAGEYAGPDIVLIESTGGYLQDCGHYASSGNITTSLKNYINRYTWDEINGIFLPTIQISLNDDGTKVRYAYLTDTFECSSLSNSDWIDIWGKSEASEDCSIVWTKIQPYDSTFIAHPDYKNSGLMQLTIRDTSGKFEAINAFCRTMDHDFASSDWHGITLRFGANGVSNYNLDVTTKDICGFKSFGEIIAALLSQIYVPTENIHEERMMIPCDVVYNKDYSELWTKDFVIKPDFNPNNLKNVVPNDLINVRQIALNTYLILIENNVKNINNLVINKNNITFKFNSNTSLVKFEHTCNYDVSNLLTIYSSIESNMSKKVYFTADGFGKFTGLLDDSVNYNLSAYYLDPFEKRIKSSAEGVKLHPININNSTRNVTESTNNEYLYITDFIRENGDTGFLTIRNGKLLSKFTIGSDNKFLQRATDKDGHEKTRFSYNDRNKLKFFSLPVNLTNT